MLAFIGLGGPEFLVIFLFFYITPIPPLWAIFKKSGQNPWFSLLLLLPGIGILIALYILAYSNWRIEK
ncbi:hypothetical protein [Spirosoma flavum]|uniref:Cardiolipin synthase N-terminal domain-containing protein n=1 Tax=Spirosoma flavum TaxID=2048557 RepID=A0ABW6APJ7_9BACT